LSIGKKAVPGIQKKKRKEEGLWEKKRGERGRGLKTARSLKKPARKRHAKKKRSFFNAAGPAF